MDIRIHDLDYNEIDYMLGLLDQADIYYQYAVHRSADTCGTLTIWGNVLGVISRVGTSTLLTFQDGCDMMKVVTITLPNKSFDKLTVWTA